jgi:hypothetical protein
MNQKTIHLNQIIHIMIMMKKRFMKMMKTKKMEIILKKLKKNIQVIQKMELLKILIQLDN